MQPSTHLSKEVHPQLYAVLQPDEDDYDEEEIMELAAACASDLWVSAPIRNTHRSDAHAETGEEAAEELWDGEATWLENDLLRVRSEDFDSIPTTQELWKSIRPQVQQTLEADNLTDRMSLLRFHVLLNLQVAPLQRMGKDLGEPVSGNKHLLCYRILSRRFVKWTDDFSKMKRFIFLGKGVKSGEPSPELLSKLNGRTTVPHSTNNKLTIMKINNDKIILVPEIRS